MKQEGGRDPEAGRPRYFRPADFGGGGQVGAPAWTTSAPRGCFGENGGGWREKGEEVKVWERRGVEEIGCFAARRVGSRCGNCKAGAGVKLAKAEADTTTEIYVPVCAQGDGKNVLDGLQQEERLQARHGAPARVEAGAGGVCAGAAPRGGSPGVQVRWRGPVGVALLQKWCPERLWGRLTPPTVAG